MKRISVIISSLLLVFITALICASCGNTVPSVDQTSSASTEAVTEPVAEYTKPDVDYGSKEFSFYLDHFKAGWMLSNYNAIRADEENGDPINDSIYKRTAKVEDELNVKITVFTEENIVDALISSILAADGAYDAAIVQQSQLARLFGNDMLYDLCDIPTLQLDKSWWLQGANEEYNVAGKQYTVLGDLCLNSLVSVSCLYFNKEIVSEYSLENPYDLVFDGKWTIDKWTELVKSVSCDIDGNGIMDEKDLFGNAGSTTVMQHMIVSSGIRVTTKNSESVPEFTLNNEKTLNVIDKVLAVLRDKSVSIYPSDYSSKFSGDLFVTMLQPMFTSNRLLFNFNWVFCALDLRNMESDFGIVPMPKYDEAQENYYSYMASAWAQYLTVPITNDEPEMTGYVLDAMGFYSQQLVHPAVVDRSVTVKGMRDTDSAKIMDILYHNIVFDLYDVYTWGNIFNIPRSCVESNQNNFASQYASLLPTAKAALEKTFEK